MLRQQRMALLDCKGMTSPSSWMPPWSGIPGQGSRRGFIGEQGKGRRLMGFSGDGKPGKGTTVEMYIKTI